MKTILINKRFYEVPEKWEELSQKQLLRVMDTLFLKGYTAEQMLLRLLQVLTGMSTFRFFKCAIEDLEDFLYVSMFLLSPDMVFTKNLIPFYKHSHTKFYGPEDFLDNLRMKEFALTENYYLKWFDSNKEDIEALNELIAILYRPAPAKYDFRKNPNGDFRERFNQPTSSYYARTYVASWPMNVKLVIATWYNGCRLHMVKVNKDVFEGGSEDPLRYGLVSVMLSVAETHVFGDFEKVEDQYVNITMMHLNETVDKGKRLEKLYGK